MDKLLTRPDIAVLFQCSIRNIYRLPLPAPVRIGHLVRWRASDIEQWLNERGAAPDQALPFPVPTSMGRPRGSSNKKKRPGRLRDRAEGV